MDFVPLFGMLLFFGCLAILVWEFRWPLWVITRFVFISANFVWKKRKVIWTKAHVNKKEQEVKS